MIKNINNQVTSNTPTERINNENVELTVETVKSATVKVDNNSKKELFELFNYFTSVASGIKDKMYNLQKDEKKAPIFNDYVKQPQRGRSAATTLFTKLDAEKTYTGKSSFPGKWRDSGVFPLYNKESEKYDLSTHGYHYSANAEIHSQLDSHNECNKECEKEYAALSNEVEKYKDEFTRQFKAENAEKFYNFVEKLTLMGWRYDAVFRSFFELHMHPKLKGGETTYRATYKLPSGKSKRYSFFRDDIADEIAKNPEFWPMLESSNAVSWIKNNDLLFRKKEKANYSHTSLIKSQIRLYLGDNGVPFTAREHDGRIYFSFRLPSINGEKGRMVEIPCSYKKVFNGKARKSCYLGGLTIDRIATVKLDKNGKKKTIYKHIFKYSVNNKKPQVAELNECFLRLVVRNCEYFNNVVAGKITDINTDHFDFYVDLPLNVKEDPIHDLSSTEVFGKNGLRSYYSSAYPEIKNLGSQIETGKNLTCPITKAHNIMGIDLGQRNPFAYFIKDNNGKFVAQGHMDGSKNETYKKYINFGKECTSVSHLIGETRSYLHGDNEAISKELYNDVSGFCNSSLSYEEYLKYLDTKKFLVNKEDLNKNTTHLLRQKEHNWVGRDWLWYISKQYKKHNENRMQDADWRQTLYWIDSLYRYIDVMKSFHNLGSFYDKNLKKKVNGTTVGFCKTIYDQINNNNDDMFKKFTNELMSVIRKHKVSVVALEKMESMLGDKSRHTFENRNYNLWPVGQLKTFMEGKLESFNVALIEIDERNTSQVCEENWSYREADDLYYIDGDKLHKVHADENAANNIVDRCISRHTNMFSLYMINPKDDYYVPTCIWDTSEEGGKRVRGFLTKMYKNSDVIFTKKDDKLVKSKMSVKELKKLVGKSKEKRGQYWYRVEGKNWINEADRDTIISNAKKLSRERDGGKQSTDTRSQSVTISVLDICETVEKNKPVLV